MQRITFPVIIRHNTKHLQHIMIIIFSTIITFEVIYIKDIANVLIFTI